MLRVHALGDFVAAALRHQPSALGEVNALIRAVELLLHNERRVGDERLGFLSAQVLVVVRALRAEEMRRARVFDEVIAGGTHSAARLLMHHRTTRREQEFIRPVEMRAPPERIRGMKWFIGSAFIESERTPLGKLTGSSGSLRVLHRKQGGESRF